MNLLTLLLCVLLMVQANAQKCSQAPNTPTAVCDTDRTCSCSGLGCPVSIPQGGGYKTMTLACNGLCQVAFRGHGLVSSDVATETFSVRILNEAQLSAFKADPNNYYDGLYYSQDAICFTGVDFLPGTFTENTIYLVITCLNQVSGACTMSWEVSALRPVDSPDGLDYIGCYKDSAAARDFTVQTTISDNTIEKCALYCKGQGLNVAGAQSGNQCYCGTSNDIGYYKTAFCTNPCPGNSSEYCGGPLANSVYNIFPSYGVTPTPTPTPTPQVTTPSPVESPNSQSSSQLVAPIFILFAIYFLNSM